MQDKDQDTLEDVLKYIPCPKCGSFSFVEYSTEDCLQSGVRLGRGNARDYERANGVELRGESIITGYVCEECDTEYGLDFETNKLTEVVPGNDSEGACRAENKEDANSTYIGDDDDGYY